VQIVETIVRRLIGRYGKPLPLPRAPDEHTYANKNISDQNFATFTQTARNAVKLLKQDLASTQICQNFNIFFTFLIET
jgi:hypothetical protein